MQTASVKWIGEQKFVAISPSGHALTFDSDRESNKAPGLWSCCCEGHLLCWTVRLYSR
jgi:hypothetical protein